MMSSLFIFQLLLSVCCAQLIAENVSEGPCRSDIQNYAADVNITWASIPRDYYVPIANEAGYRLFAEALLGRPANTKDELANMKLRTQSFKRFRFVPRGFDPAVHINQYCPATGVKRAQFNCTATKKCSSPGTNPLVIEHLVATIVYTDNKYDALGVICVNGQFQIYLSLSVGPTLNPKNEAKIKQKLRELGFSSKLVRYQKY